jgi:diaminopimelate decarboxylase
MFSKDLIKKFSSQATPFYYYDLELLKATIAILKKEADKYGFIIHYAVKANANDKILRIINENGLGADCVSGNEISKSLEIGFSNSDIVFAGVGKTDEEINLGLKK